MSVGDYAGDKALTRETPAKRGRVNRYAIGLEIKGKYDDFVIDQSIHMHELAVFDLQQDI